MFKLLSLISSVNHQIIGVELTFSYLLMNLSTEPLRRIKKQWRTVTFWPLTKNCKNKDDLYYLMKIIHSFHESFDFVRKVVVSLEC